MSTMGRPSSYFPDICALVHNDCLLGATGDYARSSHRAKSRGAPVETTEMG